MSLNYNIIDTLKMFIDCMRYNAMISIIISSIILCVLCILNKKFGKYLILVINVIILFLIGKYYIKEILSFNYSNPINNLYFYLFNSIIFIIVFSIETVFNSLDNYDYIFNSVFYIFISFTLFMTNYLNNITLIVLYNTFPMIKFGNILMLIYYLTVLTKIGYHAIIKTVPKRSE